FVFSLLPLAQCQPGTLGECPSIVRLALQELVQESASLLRLSQVAPAAHEPHDNIRAVRRLSLPQDLEMIRGFLRESGLLEQLGQAEASLVVLRVELDSPAKILDGAGELA